MGLSSKQASGENNLDEWDQNENFEQPRPVIKRQNQHQQQQQQVEKLKCPRCDSTNTKFCYYNNYNKSQPRHFCKTCKRHWTKGGTLRNVPEGGGRKNKRLKTSNSPSQSSNPTKSTSPVFNPNENINQKIELDNLPLSFGDHQKTLVPDVPYQELIPSSSNNGSIVLGSTSSISTQKVNYSDFLSSSFSIDSNPYSISSSLQQSSVYNYIGGNEATEDSTIKSIVPMTSSNILEQSLHVPVPTSCVMEMQNCWNWEDIDAFVSADMNAPWINDSEINS